MTDLLRIPTTTIHNSLGIQVPVEERLQDGVLDMGAVLNELHKTPNTAQEPRIQSAHAREQYPREEVSISANLKFAREEQRTWLIKLNKF
jgi:hypothetical protein